MSSHKYQETQQHTFPHIGSLIKNHIQANRLRPAEVARLLHITQPVLSTYFTRPSVQAAIIWNLGITLQHNFFADISNSFQQATSGKTKTTLQLQLDDVQKQLAEAQKLLADKEKEIEIYKSIITGFQKK